MKQQIGQEFLDANRLECWEYDAGKDDDQPRIAWGFGSTCPLALSSGHTSCQSFKKKYYGCISSVSKTFAVNYLAKHAFNSECHQQIDTIEDSFAAAASVDIVEETWTADDRKMYSQYETDKKKDVEKKRDAKKTPHQPSVPPPRHLNPSKPRATPPAPPDRRHSRSSRDDRQRSPTPIGSSSRRPRRSRSRQRRSPSRESNYSLVSSSGGFGQIEGVARRMADASQFAASSSVALATVSSGKKGSVRIPITELEVVENCLIRSLHTQKKLCETMQFFTRQFEDEQRIIAEAAQAVRGAIIRNS